MKNEVSPVVMAVIVIVVVVLIGGFGWYMINRQPKPANPATNSSATAPGQRSGDNQAKPIQAIQ